jgi:photosystem II stability/assembly factor-like uncharacterized protein
MTLGHPALLLSTGSPMPTPGGPPPDGVYRLDPGAEPTFLGVRGLGGVLAPVVVDTADPGRWYAAARAGGVLCTADRGLTWRECSTGLTYREVWSLAQHPLTGHLFAGTGPAALFASTDRGESWSPLASLLALPDRRSWEFPGPPFHAHIKHIALDAEDPGLIFGAVEEGGVIRSRDGGRSWVNIHDGVEFDCHSVALLPERNLVLATAGTGIYRSEDGGDTFSSSHRGVTNRYMTPLWTHPKRPGTLYAGGSQVPPPSWRRPQGADAAIYRSDDWGRGWQRLHGGLPDPLVAAPLTVAADPHDPDAVYLGFSDGTVWRSNDTGESFHVLARTPSAVYGITVLAG